jgi:hypothetical protein
LVWLQLPALAYNLGDFVRSLAVPKKVDLGLFNISTAQCPLGIAEDRNTPNE